MIVHLVLFNKLHQSKPHSVFLPSVENLAFLVQVHSMLPPTLSMSSAYTSYLNDPFRSGSSTSSLPMGHKTPNGVHNGPNALAATSTAVNINLQLDDTCLTVSKTEQWIHFY